MDTAAVRRIPTPALVRATARPREMAIHTLAPQVVALQGAVTVGTELTAAMEPTAATAVMELTEGMVAMAATAWPPAAR